MASASSPSANELAKDLILVHTILLKPIIKAPISGRMVSISDVAIASVHSEKTRLKKCMMITITIILMNKSQEMTVFRRRQKSTSAMKLRPAK